MKTLETLHGDTDHHTEEHCSSFNDDMIVHRPLSLFAKNLRFLT